MSVLVDAIGELDAHIWLLWGYVAESHYDPRSIAGDRCLNMTEEIKKVNEWTDRHADVGLVVCHLAHISNNVRAISGRLEYFDDRLVEWVREAEKFLLKIKENLSPEEKKLMERTEERLNRGPT